MRVLVTAGNTQTAVDQVRCITNTFSGRTGTSIALAAADRGYEVCLLTSHPVLADSVESPGALDLEVRSFQTFDDLESLMATTIPSRGFDAIIHCAAVSDYRIVGVYRPSPGTEFNNALETWHCGSGLPSLDDASAGKVKSQHPELWIRLLPTPKLVDKIRREWGFDGVLVKFKLEVGVSNRELIDIAEASRRQSQADLMVANSLEQMHECAWIGSGPGRYRRIGRKNLAAEVLDLLEAAIGIQAGTAIPSAV